jgi:5'-nucleotidase
MRPLILVTNDDGISSLGLLAAARSVMDLGEVWVVAPRVQQSGVGRSFPAGPTHAQEGMLDVDGAQVHAISMVTSPAKAVRHGVLRFLPRLPALAISGINYGENLGGCITVSGTIGAAIEAASFGIPTLAASLETDPKYHFSTSNEVDFSAAATCVRRLAVLVLSRGLPAGTDILKLDVPCDATPDTPWRVTRVSRQQYFVSPVSVDQGGKRHIESYVKEVDLAALESDSDVHAVAVDRAVSVTPLTVDLTAYAGLEPLEHLLSGYAH